MKGAIRADRFALALDSAGLLTRQSAGLTIDILIEHRPSAKLVQEVDLCDSTYIGRGRLER